MALTLPPDHSPSRNPDPDLTDTIRGASQELHGAKLELAINTMQLAQQQEARRLATLTLRLSLSLF